MTGRQKLAVASVVALVAAGTGAAFAAVGHGNKVSALRLGGLFASATPTGHAWGGMHMHMGIQGGDDLAAAATYLGISTATLQADLQSGKTLAQVAEATAGKSAAGLITALVAQETQELTDAVKAGRLTQAQADAITPTIQQRVTDMVNGVRPAFGPGGMHGMHGAPPDLSGFGTNA